MKILYFSQLYPPAAYGGGEYIFYKWAKELVKRGHRVCAITQRLPGEPDEAVIDGIQVYRVGPPVESKGALPTTVFENLGYLVGATLKGLEVSRKARIDIIHSNTYIPTFAGQTCAFLHRRPHVITVHDVYFYQRSDFWAKWAQQEHVSKANKAFGTLVERLVMKLPARVFHTVSETSKRDLQANSVKNVVVIPNGLDPEEYRVSHEPGRKPHQAIYVGRLVFYKNLDTVIEAFRSVGAIYPDSKLLIAGEGPYRNALRRKVEEAKMGQNVVLLGQIPDAEKVRLIHESSFLVLPSVCEGFGITVIEAFACGRPALVSTVMPLPEIVEPYKDGYCLPPYDVKAWRDAMSNLFANPQIAEELGRNGGAKVPSKYSIGKVVDQLEGLYRTCLADRLGG